MTSASQAPAAEAVAAAINARDMDRAVALASQAYAQGAREPLILNLMAYKLELDDRIEDALVVLDEAHRANPGDAFILNSIGVCLSKAERPMDALGAFDAALARDPGLAHAHNGRGLALAAIGDREAAYAAQRRAAELNPQFPEPLGALAAMAAEDKAWGEARTLATRALAMEPDQPAAAMALAACEIEAGENAAAEARMARLIATGRLTRMHLVGAHNLRADALDAAGAHEAAMAEYIAANRVLREVQIAALGPVELGADACQRFIDYFRAADPADWEPIPQASSPGGEIGHVFLVGFARSGTTLLEQVLASHADMVALEEKPTIDDTIVEFFRDAASLDRLAAMDEATVQPWRELYWRRVREFGVEPRGKVFVDKLPLHTIYLPAVAKLFPNARVLIARRDPRDVVVSCFRRRFRPNALVVEFTDLARTALVYSRFMELAEIYAQKLILPMHVHRHEDLIDDFDAQTQDICAFLGLPWDESMRDFVDTANRRDIRTPSAGQVRKGLNREGVAAWRRYGSTIDVIKPILAPWVEAFGYPKD